MKEAQSTNIIAAIIHSIQEKKGEEIVEIDLTKIENTIVERFIICHGNSSTQVEAIANNIEDKLLEQCHIKAKHIEGKRNAQWILLDYYDIIVHVFYEPIRRVYNLESLWADGEIKHINS